MMPPAAPSPGTRDRLAAAPGIASSSLRHLAPAGPSFSRKARIRPTAFSTMVGVEAGRRDDAGDQLFHGRSSARPDRAAASCRLRMTRGPRLQITDDCRGGRDSVGAALDPAPATALGRCRRRRDGAAQRQRGDRAEAADDGTILIGKERREARVPAAQARQPARPRRRRDRHRQDRDAAGAGRGLLATPACRSSPPTSRATSPASRRPGEAQGRLRQARRGARHRLRSPTASRRCSGTCSASRATRSAPPSARWGRCCSRACWSSTTPRRACSTSPSGSPTSSSCRSST